MALPPPITISDGAAERIKDLIAAREKESVGIRVGVRKGGCSGLAYTIEYADDVQKFEEVITDKGVTVIIDPKAIMYLIGSEMQFHSDQFKSGFTFVNPNVKGQCGCGESFHV